MLGVYGPVGSGSRRWRWSCRVCCLSSGGRSTSQAFPSSSCRLRPSRRRHHGPQESFLFSRSLFDNVGYDDPLDAIDGDKVGHSVERAALAGDVERMPDRLETMVGERGVMLSGGQRQRAQIARALYAGSRLLILDDVLSAVDHDTEVRLLAELQRELEGADGRPKASAVIISSRLSALRPCDKIVVLDEGRVVERGHHAARVAVGGLYAVGWPAHSDVGPRGVAEP